MDTEQEIPSTNKLVSPVTLEEFFESIPPGRVVQVERISERRIHTPAPISAPGSEVSSCRLHGPDLRLYCPTDTCNGSRFFERVGDGPYLLKETTINCFVNYRCRNCQKTAKVYAISISLNANETHGTMFKFGETPPFGPPTPARVISLIGPDKDYFLKGRRAENQALGMAAFAYYRRVVENQKNRMLNEIIRAAEKLRAPQELIDELRNAQNETQFSKAVSLIKHGM
jgi:hypothetical protein